MATNKPRPLTPEIRAKGQVPPPPPPPPSTLFHRRVEREQVAERLAEKARKVVAWMRRLEAQATAQEKANRGRFNSLADANKGDASNYRAVAQDIQQVLDEWDATTPFAS